MSEENENEIRRLQYQIRDLQDLIYAHEDDDDPNMQQEVERWKTQIEGLEAEIDSLD